MKILHVIANLATRYGGPSKAGFEMSRALVNLGHEVSIYTTNQDGPSELDVPTNQPVIKEGVEIKYFPIQKPRFWGTSLPLARALRKDILKYDIVHIHSLYLFHCVVAGYYARKHNIPYIIRPHGTLDPFLYQRHRFRKSIMEFLFENRNIKNAHALHYTTEEEGDLASPYTFNRPGIIVPNGINLSEYNNLPDRGLFRSKYSIPKDKRIILFFSRLNFKKGLDILVNAFAEVCLHREDAILVITGPDNEGYGEKVRHWLSDQGLLERTIFTGMLTGSDKLEVLRDADLFVLPSYSENFGISVVEAMACKLPVVISNKVNIWREIKKHDAGRVSSCDAKLFASEIIDLLNDDELRLKIGGNGRILVEDYFQWEMVGQILESYYKEILNNKLSSEGYLARPNSDYPN